MEIEIEEPLQQLAERDSDIREDLEKVQRALGTHLGKTKITFLLSYLPYEDEISKGLRLPRVPIKSLGKWKYFSFYVAFLVGLVLSRLSDDWNFLSWQLWIIMGVAIGTIEICKHGIEKEIRDRRGLLP